jgi:putative sterol carrier protein
MALKYGTGEWESAYQTLLADRTQKPPPYIYFTPEWASLYEKAIQQDAKYKEASEGWEWPVVLNVEQDPDYGLIIDLYLMMDLWHGECRSVRFVPPEVGREAAFVISGSLERWTQVGKKELDITKGMMQGKLKLKGDLPTIVRAIKASTRLTEISVEVGGIFPTDFTDEDKEEVREVCRIMSEKLLG